MYRGLIKSWDIFYPGMKKQALLLLVLMIIGALFEAGGIGIIYPVLDITINGRSSEITGLTEWALSFSERFFTDDPVRGLFWITFLIYLLKNAYLVGMNYYQLNFSYKNRAILAGQLFDLYLSNSYEFHIQRNSADLLRNITTGISEVMVKFVLPTIVLITEFLVVSIIAIMLAIISPKETGIALVLVCLFAGFYYLLIRNRVVIWGREAFGAWEEMITCVNQGLGGVKVAKVFGTEDFFSQIFSTAVFKQSMLQKRMSLAKLLPRYFLETILVGGVLTTLIIMTPDGEAGADLIPVMGMIGMAAIRLLPSFNRISGSLAVLRSALPVVDKIHEDIKSAVKAHCDEPRHQLEEIEFSNHIEIKELTFHFENSDSKILSNINLTIGRNECVALVGASGAGKTSLADCILGLLEPGEGDIKVDGVSIFDNISAWRKHIGYIPQDVFLTDDTLRRNIAYGLPDSKIDDALVFRAIEKAQLLETVANMPAGVDTEIGERGVSISGGQRQRVGIARALYRDTSLLVLDEATSALDGETEAEFISVLENLRKEKCIIIIAHRQNTIRHCDCLYYLDNGRVVDQGTFDDLAARNEEFRRMINYADFKRNEANIIRV